jgi:hypothetical protein
VENRIFMAEHAQNDHWDRLFAILALLSFADLAAGQQMWSMYAPSPLAGLVRPGGRSAGGFWFDADEARYGRGNAIIPEDSVRRGVLAFLATAAAAMRRDVATIYTGTYRSGDVQSLIASRVRGIHLALAIIGRGGIDRVREADLHAVSSTIAFQFDRLKRFAATLAGVTAESPFRFRGPVRTGTVDVDAAARRAGNYASSALSTWDIMRRRAAVDAGYKFERNILGAAEHCAWFPGAPRQACPDLTKLGYVPIGTLPPIGTRLCLWNCRCRMSFSRSISNAF